ncbi:ExbD/TolR family protein [Parachryseolinea silvisoli]|jgi:biopolymer transport protein ExbD|uniref:ExbD/TolR family protein n=1 Tax=Parachryseolinea silvisoli TaxID=2873601 RepID=UPI002265BB0A|nr:biopolymer transporter ExbD [Parachryseolinea silvisoli]MCD9015013.1 biopolymer transporter ExbD [Parachryseolinea silvisoli]
MAEIQQGGGGGKKGGKVRAKKMSTKIDMTPMVDLAFLLLTFFMLTTTFSKPQTMEITMPEKPKEEDKLPEVNEKKVVTLILGANDKIYWYHGITDPKVEVTDFSANGIRKILLKQAAEIPGMILLIKPGDDSRYKNMVDILDEMNITNMQRYALVKITDTDKELVKESNL